MRILLVELDYHPEVLDGMYNLLKEDHNVSILSRKPILDKTRIDFQNPNVYTYEHIDRNKIESARFDSVIYTTAQTNFYRLNKLKISGKKYVIVHNVNSYFDQSKINFKLHPFYLWKDISYFIRVIVFKRELHHKRYFLSNIDFFLFPSEFMLNQAKKLTPEETRYVENTVTWKYQEFEPKKPSEIQEISVIGAIDRRRRDYSLVVNLVRYLDKRLSNKIVVNILGNSSSCYGGKIVEKLKKSISSKIQVRTFKNHVGENDFIEIVKNSSCLISPIKQKNRHHIWLEKYGVTKITGSINDAIRFSKPIFIPSFYPIPASLSKLIFPFQSQEDLNEKTLALLDKGYEFKDIKSIEKRHTKKKLNKALMNEEFDSV